MLIEKRTTNSEEETMQTAARLARTLRPGDIVALDGPLGAGKTCFVRGLARGLGLDEARVSSPTFIICQEYDEPDHVAVEHIDAYRLSGADDLESIGWDEMLGKGGVIIAIEWPSRIDEAIPRERRIDVQLRHAGEQQREITISAFGAVAARLNQMNADECG